MMIQWFQSFFKKSDLPPAHEESAWENFTFKIIHEIKYNRSPLTIKIAGHTQPFASLILEVDSDREILVLDELFPQEGNTSIKAGQMIGISCRNNGILVEFDCKLLKVVNHHGLHGLLVHFPNDLNYMQRRETFRAEVPKSNALIAQFMLPNEPNYRATIEDISLTGMRIRVPHNITEHLQDRMQIENCKIILPSDECIHVHFKVCHFDYKPEQHGTILGCEFKMLPPVEQREINKLVTNLQRLERTNTSRETQE